MSSVEENVLIGIVILNYNTYNKTIECVNSIITTCAEKMVIYIIDNNSPNNSYEKLTQKYRCIDYVKVIKSDENGGYAKGNNIGLKACLIDECKYVIVSNNDIIFCNNSIKALSDFIKNAKDSILAGPKIYTTNLKVQHSTILKEKTFLEYLGYNGFNKKQLKKELIDEENIHNPVKVYSVSGCCFIINLDRFMQLGGFDEGTFLYNEENILSFKIDKSDFNVYFVPGAEIIHAHGATTGKQNMFVNREFLKSGLYYWKKYRNISKYSLFFMWFCFTARWLIKSLYCKDLRKGWKLYLNETLKTLLQNK